MPNLWMRYVEWTYIYLEIGDMSIICNIYIYKRKKTCKDSIYNIKHFIPDHYWVWFSFYSPHTVHVDDVNYYKGIMKWGKKMGIKKEYAPITEEKISDFEQKIGFELPDDYKKFILKTNGGIPRPNEFIFTVLEGNLRTH